MAWSLKCSECGAKESFFDSKDITYNKWYIIAWLIKENEPLVVCPNCDYKKPNSRKKKSK